MQRVRPLDPVVLLGDESAARFREELNEQAGRRGCVILAVFLFASGAAAAADDLGEVEEVVSALACAISYRVDVWVPRLGVDLGREQHARRLSLVLQRHGLNLRFGPKLAPVATTGGYSAIDVALRREVRAVDHLDHAALAAAGVSSMGREIERLLTEPGPAAPERGTDAAPLLPAPTTPWPQRQPMLRHYARWLVHDCGVTQAATARVLNSTGQRTARGRHWRSGTVSALLTGSADRTLSSKGAGR